MGPDQGAGLDDGVRERRRAVGMTLAELAHAAGVSEATLSRHERGIVASPSLVRFVGDELVASNEALETALRECGAQVIVRAGSSHHNRSDQATS